MSKPVAAHATFLQSRRAKTLGAAACLVVSYVIFSKALDTGSYWHYFGGFVFFVIGVKFMVRTLRHGKD